MNLCQRNTRGRGGISVLFLLMPTALNRSMELRVEGVIRGHHVYKRIWAPHLGEQLTLAPESDNDHDRRAVAVLKGSTVVGHVPRSLSRIVWYILRRGGIGRSEVSGNRRKGFGLEALKKYLTVHCLQKGGGGGGWISVGGAMVVLYSTSFQFELQVTSEFTNVCEMSCELQ